MAWFWKKKEGEERPTKVQIAEGLWVKCDSCKEIVYRAEVDRAGRVCPRCRYPFRISARERIASLVDEISVEYKDKLKVCKLDVDGSRSVPARYGVRGIPTLLLFKGGELKETMVGALPKDKIVATISKHF